LLYLSAVAQKQSFDLVSFSMQLAKDMVPYQQAANQQAQKLYEQYQKNGISGMKTSAATPDNIYRYVAEKSWKK